MAFTVYGGGGDDWKTTADKEALKRFAKTIDVDVDGRSGIETIRKDIALKLGESVEPVSPKDYEPPPEEPSKIGAADGFDKNKAEIAKDQRWVCVVHSTERDSYPAPAAVNGVWFIMPRDEERVLPECVIRHYQKAVIELMKFDPAIGTNRPVKMPRFPISKLRMATEEDIKNPALNAQVKASDAPQYSVG